MRFHATKTAIVSRRLEDAIKAPSSCPRTEEGESDCLSTDTNSTVEANDIDAAELSLIKDLSELDLSCPS